MNKSLLLTFSLIFLSTACVDTKFAPVELDDSNQEQIEMLEAPGDEMMDQVPQEGPDLEGVVQTNTDTISQEVTQQEEPDMEGVTPPPADETASEQDSSSSSESSSSSDDMTPPATQGDESSSTTSTSDKPATSSEDSMGSDEGSQSSSSSSTQTPPAADEPDLEGVTPPTTSTPLPPASSDSTPEVSDSSSESGDQEGVQPEKEDVEITNDSFCAQNKYSLEYSELDVLACPGSEGGQRKFLVCHQTGSKKKPWHYINIAEPAVNAHITHHGDYIVDCNILDEVPQGKSIKDFSCECP